MQIVTFTAYSAEELGGKIRDLKKHLTPTLALAFASPFLDIGDSQKTLQEAGCAVFGASTAGEILTGNDPVPVTEQSVVCCLLDPDPSTFSIRLFSRDGLSSFELGHRAGTWGAACFERPAFLVAACGLTNDAEAILKGMTECLPTGTKIAGGVAADDHAFEQTFTFSHDEVTDDGIVVMVMDSDRITLSSFTTSGWKGVGVEMTVTSSEGNIVRSIDGRVPVDLVSDYLGIKKEDVIATALNFPMLVRRNDGSEVLRTALSVDYTTGALIYAGSVPEGSKIRFSSSFGIETLESTIREINEYHKGLPDADLIILFDCCARHEAAGKWVNDEIDSITRLWKVPVIGFFTYGEIGHSCMGGCDVYNETLSLAILKFV
jgi:hypothetical protein